MSWKDWLFPPAWQQKASAVTRLMVAIYNGQPAWTPRNYADLAKEGFEQNIWVYRCVMAIAQAVGSVDWVLYGDATKKKEIDTHKLLDLLYRPNEFMSKQEFFEAVTAYLCLSGNGYMEANGPNSGPPMELFPLRPDRMTILPDSKNLIAGYMYSVGENKYTWDSKKVAHLKLFSATQDLYGMSPIEVAARSVDNDNAATTWNNALLNNGARPTGAMTTDNILSDPQYEKLKNEINTQYKGAKNAGRPMLLEAGLKWQEMGLSPKDMDFINSKKMSRLEICAAFGVPPEIVGDKEHATYSNYQEARQSFYQETVLPYLDKMRDKLNSWLVPQFGERLYLDYDIDSIEALNENQDALWTRISSAWEKGILKQNEARAAIGYEEVEGGDVFFSGGGSTQEVIDPNAETDPGTKGFFLKNFNLVSEEQKTAYWKSVDRRRMGYEKKAIKLVANHFKKEKEAILKAFNDGGEKAVIKVITGNKKELAKLLTTVDLTVIKDFGQATFNQLKSQAVDLEIKLAEEIEPEDAFNVFDTEVQSYISTTVAKKVVGITDTTMLKVRAVLGAGEALGESIVQLAKRVDTLYLDQIIPNRSVVIARTEIISSSNAGNRFAAKQTGLNLEKEWIATRDDRTRESHEDLDGQTKKMDEPYRNGLMFPGDPHGSAKEVIQCRCAEGYKVIKKPK